MPMSGMPHGMPVAHWTDHPSWFKNAPTSFIHGKRGRGRKHPMAPHHLHGDRLLSQHDAWKHKGESKNG